VTVRDHYLVAGAKPWNRRVFDDAISRYPGIWHFIERPGQLTVESLRVLAPRYIFFLHWSWRVPLEIITQYECVCFHMTDVPYGRGGSPLQNLIVRGHRHTKLTALRMVEDFDAGPFYMKEDLCLEGRAEEIYEQASELSAQMIRRIISEQPNPEPQVGEPTFFMRRKPEESRIPELYSAQALYDFVRMLDAEGYPHAFLEHSGFLYEFTRAAMSDEGITAMVKIRSVEKPNP